MGWIMRYVNEWQVADRRPVRNLLQPNMCSINESLTTDSSRETVKLWPMNCGI
jgi:hypothetical protein